MRLLLALATVVLVTGCATTGPSPNYQFGDGTKKALSLQVQYCAESDPQVRAVLLATLRRLQVPVPASGACSGLVDLIDPSTVLHDVDVEQAIEDQKKFQERIKLEDSSNDN